jgi:hypothetical protein
MDVANSGDAHGQVYFPNDRREQPNTPPILKSDELWSSYRCEGNSYAVIVKPLHDFVSLRPRGL